MLEVGDVVVCECQIEIAYPLVGASECQATMLYSAKRQSVRYGVVATKSTHLLQLILFRHLQLLRRGPWCACS